MSTQSLSGETRIASSSRRLIAPRWHTTVVVLAFLGLAIGGVMFKGSTALTKPAPSHWALYIALIIAEVGLYYFVRLGLRKGGTPISDILGQMDPSIPAWTRDAAIAAVVWVFWIGIAIMAARFAKSSPDISGLMPNGVVDGVLWVGVSFAAGIAEEVAFRGYLLRQFQAITGNVWLSLVLQAAVFSIAHGYEGFTACASIALFGFLFGIVAIKTGNLRACIIAHAWTNIAAGLL